MNNRTDGVGGGVGNGVGNGVGGGVAGGALADNVAGLLAGVHSNRLAHDCEQKPLNKSICRQFIQCDYWCVLFTIDRFYNHFYSRCNYWHKKHNPFH